MLRMVQCVPILLVLTIIPVAWADAPSSAPSPASSPVAINSQCSTTTTHAVSQCQVTFTDHHLSVTAQQVSLQELVNAITRQTGVTIVLSPAFAALPITISFTDRELETGLREIIRHAGITNSAWSYRKNPTATAAEKWELARVILVTEGHGTALPALSSSDQRNPSTPATGSAPHKLAREQYRDSQTNQLIDIAKREVLVRFDPQMSADQIKEKIARLNSEVISQTGSFGLYHLLIPESESVTDFIQKHENDPNLRLLEPNPIVTVEPVTPVANDPLFPVQWGLERIEAPQAWAHLSGTAGVTVAIIDSGIDSNHPDLRGKVIPGWNAIDQNDDTRDQHGHGTALAGIIAANMNDAIGMAGVCPHCPLLPVKVLDEAGEGTYAQVIAGILWAAERKPQVINFSLGSYGYSRFLADAVEQAYNAGAVLVAAAGNEATAAALYPAALPHVISVSGTDSADHFWTGSNYGARIDMAAPALNILSLDAGSGYLLATGTSFSAAHVSGVAALLRTQHAKLTNAQVAQVLFETADDLGEKGKDTLYGYGRINAGHALRVKPR
ncbi:MAG: S8 family serine peptidase [Candidatus Binatia bacterium]